MAWTQGCGGKVPTAIRRLDRKRGGQIYRGDEVEDRASVNINSVSRADLVVRFEDVTDERAPQGANKLQLLDLILEAVAAG